MTPLLAQRGHLASRAARLFVALAVCLSTPIHLNDALADDLPQPPFNGPNWVAHLDDPPGTVSTQFIGERFYEHDFTDSTDQTSQQHHLICQIHNLENGSKTVKVKFKVKRPGGVEKIKDTGTYILPASGRIILPPIKYDERDILKNSSDTGKLRLKVRWGNNVNGVEFGVLVAEDPPCTDNPGTCGVEPECACSTVMEDPEPPDPENYIEVSLEEVADKAVPAMTAPFSFVLFGLILLAGWIALRRRRSAVI
jgi:hypothetical protein